MSLLLNHFDNDPNSSKLKRKKKPSRPQYQHGSVSSAARVQPRAYSDPDNSSSVVKETGFRRPGKHDWLKNMPTITRFYFDDNRASRELKKILEKRYGFHATTKLFETELDKKQHDSRASTLKERDRHVDKVSQRRWQLRIMCCMPFDFQVGHPSDSLTFKGHDAFQVYEAIFIAARDYTNARIQNTVETPSYIFRAYSAMYLICVLLSAAGVGQGTAPTFRRKPTKRVRVLNELMHLLPCMFTQVVLLANGPGKLATASMESLQYADAAASKIPGWPPRHPMRRILSNLVVLGHSEDPGNVAQVAENARKCVLETCNNKGLRSTEYSDQLGRRHFTEGGERFRKVLRQSTFKEIHIDYAEKTVRGWNMGDNPVLQTGWIFELEHAKLNARSESTDDLRRNHNLPHITRQLNEGLGGKPTSDIRNKSQRAEVDERDQLNNVPRNCQDLGTLSLQQGEQAAIDHLDDGPCQSSAESAVLVLKEKGDYMGILDRFRLYIEQFFGEELDWRPLPPIKHPEVLDQSRISWTYNGMTMSIILNKEETLRHGGGRNNYYGSSSILPVCQPTSQTGTSASTSTSGGADPKDSGWKQVLPWSWKKSDRGNSGPPRSDPGNKGTAQQMESHLCVDKCWSSTHDTRMITLESVEHMKSDYEYFREARHILSQAEGGWLQRKLSWRSYTRVTLSRFHFLFDNSDKVEAIESNSLPCPQDVCDGYEFKCPKRAEIDIQMRIYAKIILEGIRCPELGRDSTTLLDGIPKLKAPPGLAKKAMNSGWGFHARHGLSVVKMLGWAMAILLMGLGFVPFWLSSIDRLDLQGALAPASFLVTVVTLWVAVLAVNSGFKQ